MDYKPGSPFQTFIHHAQGFNPVDYNKYWAFGNFISQLTYTELVKRWRYNTSMIEKAMLESEIHIRSN